MSDQLTMNDQNDLVSEQTANAVLNRLFPSSILKTITPLAGSFANATCLVTATSPDDSLIEIVIRRYAVFGNYDRGEKARREYRLYGLLDQSSVPVPEPLLLDDTGAVLDSPGIVTRYVRGLLDMTPANPLNFATAVARTLADIHRIPCDTFDRDFLLDAHSEALWFLKTEGAMPAYIAAHPRGAEVWSALKRLLPTIQTVPFGLVHMDYWSAQLLWENGQIVAVLDWEEVAYGDPVIDVAYCYMDMVLSGNAEAGAEFLSVYEQEMGRKLQNLEFWKLAAAVRPMVSPEGWVSESPAPERFSQFIDDALRKSSL